MSESRRRLRVQLHGDLVGELRYEDEKVEFRLDSEYIELADRPVLGQVFEDDLHRSHRVSSGVPPWFANLLPEGPLREFISRQMGVGPTRSFFLLAGVGSDLPGAVSVEPDTPVDIQDPLAHEDGNAVHEAEDSVYEFKFSLAGVQLKFSAMAGERGLTIPVHGVGGEFIVKLPDLRFDRIPENEWTMMTWARQSGVTTPDVELVDLDLIAGLPDELRSPGRKGFSIRRFDRDGTDRVHTEDFAQVLNHYPDFKGKYGGANYESIARIVHALGGFEDVEELVKRIVMMVAMGNGDAHLKNFSLIYPDRRRARLSPAYDLLATETYIRGQERLALNLAGSKLFEDVDLESFRRLASKIGLDEGALDPIVLKTVERAQSAWRDLRSEAPAAEAVLRAIDFRLASLPLMKL